MLHLWMPEANGVWQWSIGEEWHVAQHLEQLIQEIQAYHGQEVAVFFPSRGIQILQQELTKAQYKQLGAEGVRYLLEEYIVSPIDSMVIKHHFNDDVITVLGIEKALVETLQHALSLIPVQVVALLPDFLILPVPQVQQQVLVQLNERLLVRSAEYVGHSIDALAVYLEYQTLDDTYVVSGLSEQHMQLLQQHVTPQLIHLVDYQYQPLKKVKQHPLNVLIHRSQPTSLTGYLPALVAVVLLSVVVQLSYDGWRWYKMQQVADQTAQQAIEQYQHWFGKTARISEQNLKSQFESQLRLNQQANIQALQILSRVGPVLMQHQIVAQQVDYHDAVLELSLQAHSSEVLQKLTQQLNQQGFNVELGNIQPQDSAVIGRVKIQ